jgi:DNA-binding LacI/PurR family transcriptional regulator
VAERLSRRILAGDYHVHGIPAERELAQDVGVSHMTARKAIQLLLEEGLVYRQPNGRLAVARDKSAGRAGGKPRTHQIVLLAPAWESNDVSRWYIALAQLGERFDCSFRVVYYGHWDDPVIKNSVEGFDGAFLVPIPEPLPPEFIPSITGQHNLVVLSADWTHHGIPSVRLFSAVFVQRLLDHLADLGHTRIGCFNVQPRDPVMAGYISQWRVWMAARGFTGPLIDEPVEPYSETLQAAYEAIAQRVAKGDLGFTALLCTMERAAAGAMRAMADAGLRPGKDVAVCTIDGAGRAEYSIPTVTSLKTPDPKPYLAVCLEWLTDPARGPWRGPLMVQPADIALAVRQSTVADVDQSTVPARRRRRSGPGGETPT